MPSQISIHALLAESDHQGRNIPGALPISIHALLAESDRTPTTVVTLICISIHALLAESDGFGLARMAPYAYFYPRSPCGERLFNPFKTLIILTFLSTLSLRRATKRLRQKLAEAIISIHALLAESDLRYAVSFSAGRISIHALLAESDVPSVLHNFRPFQFLSTLSLRRATNANLRSHRGNNDFYPRSPCGERPDLWVM